MRTPTIEKAKRHETCDVCGRRGTMKNEVFSIFGARWAKIHRRCLAWTILTIAGRTPRRVRAVKICATIQ